VPCGTRSEAYDQFARALAYRTHDTLILLVDSEGPIAEGTPKWLYVHRRPDDKWSRPDAATEQHLHFMAECMETWITADPKALAVFYGKDFNARVLPATTDLETVPKADLARKLAEATKACRPGAYHKTAHGFRLLGAIDPASVASRCPTHAAALFAFLRQTLTAR
jgi:hypothetical protein